MMDWNRGFFRFQRHGLIETVSVPTHLRYKGSVVARGDHSEIVGAFGAAAKALFSHSLTWSTMV